jgi:two-component system response regulator NreC
MKIVVIEDHQLVREMLVLACANNVAKADVRGASSGAEGVALCRGFQPDLVFLDLDLPDGDGLARVPEIFAIAPGAKIIALTSHTDEFTVHRALRSNVNGFVDKNEQPLEVLREAVATAMDGRQYFSSTARRVRLAMRNDPNDFTKVLSDREQELLTLFGEGLDNDEIAGRLGISTNTVRLHRNKIMIKLNVHGTPQLIRYAIDRGFTRPKTTRP